MEKIQGEKYDRTEVVVDGKEFTECSFENCMMVYAGDGGSAFLRCSFKDVMWLFEGAVGREIRFDG